MTLVELWTIKMSLNRWNFLSKHRVVVKVSFADAIWVWTKSRDGSWVCIVCLSVCRWTVDESTSNINQIFI